MSVERRGIKALELWAKKATQGYDGVNVENMTTAWRNGLAFCALIHHFKPDLIDFDSLKAENVLENNALAYRVAEQHLGIPALLDADDMLESLVPDRLSILTYVSQFYQAFGSPTVIKSPKESPLNQSTKTSSPLSPQKTPYSSPIIVAAKAKHATIPSKKEADFKTDKMATGGFKVKREECNECQKPVFIAERILVGSPIQLRHRTCFRCARCTAQLNLVNYYVTEKGQFCCETCPDEEKCLSSEGSNNIIRVEISSSSECDSDSDSSHSINVSLSSAADQSSTSGSIFEPKPRTIFLNNVDNCQNVTEPRKDNEKTSIVDGSTKERLASPLNHNSIANNSEESTKSTNNGTVIRRLEFFENKSETKDISTEISNVQSLEKYYPILDYFVNDSLKQKNDDEAIIEREETTTEVPILVSHSAYFSSEKLNSKEMKVEMEVNNKEHSNVGEVQGKEETRVEKYENISSRRTSLQEITHEWLSTSKEEIYPCNLNPFGSDQDDKKDSDNKLNPFVSSDEGRKRKSSINKNAKINRNPFWSDDEDYLHSFQETPSKPKSPPPRPPPPTLKRHEIPDGKIPVAYSSNLDKFKSFPSSPALSIRSTTDTPTLRIKKKQKPAPIPPDLLNRNTLLDKNVKICLNDNKQNISKEAGDEVLSSKIEKDKRNQSSKMNENYNQQKDACRNKQVILTTKYDRGEWKRKKGPAPPRPVPQKRAIRALPISQIRQELDDIEVKQTELERQGVIMETLIRNKTENSNETESFSSSIVSELKKCSTMSSDASHPGIEVEDLILQLFELVNEKNELFRRQTELMYLKREKRLEEEHAELEYQIRCSILKPNRSEHEIQHEEELIARLMKVVELRDQVVNCLEMERQREAVEDESIATHMIKYQEKYIEGIDSNEETKHKKKNKLRLLKKKKKKSDKDLSVDADKDVDESEIKVIKKKKKKWFKKVELRPS